MTVAVALGIGMLHGFDKGADPYSQSLRTTTKTPASAPVRSTTTSSTPGATTPARPPNEVKVLPANGTTTPGAGSKVGVELQRAGYNVLSATNTTRPANATVVYYAPGHQSEASAVAQLLGLAETAVQALPNPPPVPDTRGADVVVAVGPDLAQRSSAGAETTTTAVRRLTPTTAARTPTTLVLRPSTTVARTTPTTVR